MTQSKDSIRKEKSRINHLLDQENRTCAKCKDKKITGCNGCFHLKRKEKLQIQKDAIIELMK